MKVYSLSVTVIFTCCICRYASVELKPELKKSILKFGRGTNHKYEGMLAHSFDRFYVVTKFILPMVNDLKFSTIKFEENYDYLQEEKGHSSKAKQ